MKKNDFRGFKQVFLFEFMTGIKKPVFIVMLSIICAMGLFITPIMTIVNNMKDDSSKDETKSVIESVYVYDETGLSLDYSAFTASEKYSDVFSTNNIINHFNNIFFFYLKFNHISSIG